VRVDDLANELSAVPGIEGVTFSGGEPMSQAAALVALIDQLRCRDLSFVCYTGFTLEYLRQNGTSAQRALLERLDILIDGPYVASRHTDLRWRGSDNQRVLLLTDRYRHLSPLLNDRGSWLEIEYASDGSVHWMGIPPKGFRVAFEQALARVGITLLKEHAHE
jgi:anaerobic ribonucleoside-triphosphate reductase activating protein